MRFWMAFMVAWPWAASAQTLTIEIDANVPQAVITAPVVVAPQPAPRAVVPAIAPPPRPIVVVPSLAEDDALLMARSRDTVSVRPRVDEPPPVARSSGDDFTEGWGSVGTYVESLSLDGIPLAMGNPEVSVLQGARLDSRWAGMQALHGVAVAGGQLRIEQRAFGFLRAPVFTFSLGGADLGGPMGHLPGTPDEITVAARSLVVARAELALGVQIPDLGPFLPYLLLRGSAGAYWLGVQVEHASLGSLGGETIDNAIFELGMELGCDIQIARGLELQLAGRANFLGPPAAGVLLGIGFGGR